MEYQFQIQCDQGVYRSNNEDAILYGVKHLEDATGNKNKIAWMVIADGMGGHNAGEVASEILTKQVESAVEQLEIINEIDWNEWITQQFEFANNKIFEQAQDDSSQHGMGTTGVVAILVDNETFVGWVGDSRGYWLGNSEDSGAELEQITKDHTMVQLLVDKGAMTQEDAEKANNKNMLSRAVGIKSTIEVDTNQHALHRGDVLFLSTDGLHDSLSESQLIDYLTKASQGDPIESQMLKDAISAGSRDNISFGSITMI